jgi:hypothetical protein
VQPPQGVLGISPSCVPRLNARVGEIQKWQLGHGSATQPEGRECGERRRGANYFGSLRGEGQVTCPSQVESRAWTVVTPLPTCET